MVMNQTGAAGCLAGKAIVITGAGRGLGAAYARLAASEGARVVVNDIDEAAASTVARDITERGGQAFAEGSDISSWDGAAALVAACIERYGGLDGLVNNAALFHMAGPDAEDEGTLRALISVNLFGTAFCGIHALRHMIPRQRGAIVNITSGAQAGSSLQGIYGASKGAVASLTYSWAIDAAVHGIRVNAFSPMARTHMADKAKAYLLAHDRKPWPELSSTPEDNAPVVVFLLSDHALGVHGQVLRLDGGRLSLMTHPAVLHPPIQHSSWTVEDVRAAWDGHLQAHQLPLGGVATDWCTQSYDLPYSRQGDGSGALAGACAT